MAPARELRCLPGRRRLPQRPNTLIFPRLLSGRHMLLISTLQRGTSRTFPTRTPSAFAFSFSPGFRSTASSSTTTG